MDRGFFVAGVLAAFVLTTMCAFPAIAQQKRLADETAKRFHVFPQIADGGGWRSFLLVANVAQSTSRCTFELHGLTMDRFQDVGIATAGSTATFELRELGSYLVWGTRNESALAAGYGILDCSAPVVAQVLFASRDGSGTTTGIATVFSSQAGEIFQFPVLTADATLGFAVANDTADDASCRIVLQTYQGVNQGEANISVPSKSNVAQFLHQLIQIPEAFLWGSAKIGCDQPVSIIGLQFDGALFTTLPPVILYTRATPDPDRFQLFNECRAVTVSVEDLPDMAIPGLTREAIHDAVELKLRSARLFDADDLLGDHLYVNVNYTDVSVSGNIIGTAFHVWVAFERWVSESISGESWYAPVWNRTVVGTASTGTDTILQTVGQAVDSFVLEYLRVNEEACG